MFDEPVVRSAATRSGVTPAQVVLRCHVQLGSVPIPKSADPGRQRENLAVFDFELADREVEAITGLGRADGRWQPNLEKRHAQLKGTQLLAPMLLRDPVPIECTIRQAMTDQGLTELSLYPEDRGCTASTTARILEILTGVARHQLTAGDGTVPRTFQPELTDLQHQALDLLDIPIAV